MHAKMIMAAGVIFGLGTIATGDELYNQGFENTDWLGSKYYDTGDAGVAHDLINNEGEAWVDVDGMNAAYSPFDPAGSGLVDGDYAGVTNYANSAGGSMYEGDQAYQMSDTDGIMTLTSDVFATAEYVSVALYLADTGWEDADWMTVTMGGIELYRVGGTDDDGAAMEDASGEWFLVWGWVSGGALEISFASNSGQEALFIDAISISDAGVPAPGAIALLGLAGFARRRRR